MSNEKLIYKSGDDWTFDLIDKAWAVIEEIAKELETSYYPAQIEIVSAEQMLDAYTSVGMPIGYRHWSYGKEFIRNEKMYKAGRMGLAYELVINSDPCIAYLMEENNMNMQTMVMAHACVGHSAVFKENYLFKDNTDAKSIVDYLAFSKNYIEMCEEKYGYDETEKILDACHALSNYGIDKYKKNKNLLRVEDEEKIALERFEQALKDYNPMWEKLVKKSTKIKTPMETIKFPKEPVENILHFIEQHAPLLEPWKREIIKINRKISQYFSPQRQTKTLNEGYASFCHYYIMTRMEEEGYIDEGSYQEFLLSHTGVIFQPDHDSKYFNPGSPFNPYALGFAIFMDIKRMCENPTEEDWKFFPDLCGKKWQTEVNYAMRNYNDETFILQYLSPKVVRDMRIFHLENDSNKKFFLIKDIQDDLGFRAVREALANMHSNATYIPDIQVTNVDMSGNRTLELTHFPRKDVPLNSDMAEMTLEMVADLWEFPVELKTISSGIDGYSKYARTYKAMNGKYVEEEDTKINAADSPDWAMSG